MSSPDFTFKGKIKCPNCRQFRDGEITECPTCAPKTLMERVAKLEVQELKLQAQIDRLKTQMEFIYNQMHVYYQE